MTTPNDLSQCLAAYETKTLVREQFRLAEAKFHLPDCLLFAVAWRETGVVNERGDYGHGHGIFQLDDRSHVIPPGFDVNVSLQIDTAGTMLSQLLFHYRGNINDACCAYNAGSGSVDSALIQRQDPNDRTTGGNYGRDVFAHLVALHARHIVDRRNG